MKNKSLIEKVIFDIGGRLVSKEIHPLVNMQEKVYELLTVAKLKFRGKFAVC